MPLGPSHLRFASSSPSPASVQIMQIRGSVHSCRFGLFWHLDWSDIMLWIKVEIP